MEPLYDCFRADARDDGRDGRSPDANGLARRIHPRSERAGLHVSRRAAAASGAAGRVHSESEQRRFRTCPSSLSLARAGWRAPSGPPEHRKLRERTGPGLRHHHDEESLPEAEQIERRLTSRYGNPAVVRLVQSMSAEQSPQLYLEVSGLIDARHLKPSTYDARVKQAAKNLCQAIENRRLSARPTAWATIRPGSIASAATFFVRPTGGSISGAEDAYQAVQWTMQAGERDAGLRPRPPWPGVYLRRDRFARQVFRVRPRDGPELAQRRAGRPYRGDRRGDQGGRARHADRQCPSGRPGRRGGTEEGRRNRVDRRTEGLRNDGRVGRRPDHAGRPAAA